MIVSVSPDQRFLRQHELEDELFIKMVLFYLFIQYYAVLKEMLEDETSAFFASSISSKLFPIIETQKTFRTHFNIHRNRPQIDFKVGGELQKHRSSSKTEINQRIHHCQQEPQTRLTKLVRLYARIPSCQHENIRYLSTFLGVSESSSVFCKLRKDWWFEGLHSVRNWGDFPWNAAQSASKLPKSYPILHGL